MPLLRINPFSFPEDVHVLEHIDRLVEIFNVCWPMYAAMPAVLKDSIERAYSSAGWNLDTSECNYVNSNNEALFPSFVDVLQQIDVVMNESTYSSDSKGDYKGALCTRVRSLTNGLYGQILTGNELSPEELFDENVIVDLSRVGSSETKSLIMGLLIMKLQEYRMSSPQKSNRTLNHVTVLEEAHNILKRTSTEQYADGANLIGKSVEMLSNSIAEMRTYGEGFIIADQAPGLLDMSVIRNTNTKIIFRIPDLNDRELVGRAANLNSEQIDEVARLKTFVAAVYQNNWLEPVLCKIDVKFSETADYKTLPLKDNRNMPREEIIKYLLMKPSERKDLDGRHMNELRNSIWKLPISADVKIAFLKFANAKTTQELQMLRGKILYSLFNVENVFAVMKDQESDISSWYRYVKELLKPDITGFSEKDQIRILAVLSKERANKNGSPGMRAFHIQLMNYMEDSIRGI
jgi:hypothetical protein